MAKYLDQKDDLYAGRTPRSANQVGLTVRELVNKFLTAKKVRLDQDDLAQRTFLAYWKIGEKILNEFGRNKLVSELRAEDFDQLRLKFAIGVGPVTLSNLIRLTRIVFKYGYDADLIDKPVKTGPGFKPPSRKTVRTEKQSKPLRLFEAAELRQVIEAASIDMKAMTLLAINCGFGNTDCANLPITALDLAGGWITYPRPKTAVMRRCPLWRETLVALKAAIASRPKAKRPEFEGLVFLNARGVPFVRQSMSGNFTDSLSRLFALLLKDVGIKRENLNYYAVRHSFETVAGATRDQIAVNSVMGHAAASSDMSSHYRERIDDDRLKAVTDHVRAWLWPETIKTKATKKPVKKTTVK